MTVLNIVRGTEVAGAAVASNRFVKATSNGKVIQAAAAGDDAVGVSAEAASGDGVAFAVAVYNGGVMEVEAGAAVTISGGAVPVCSDSVGRAVAVSAATDRILGYAQTSAGGAGEIIQVRLVKGASHRDA